MRKSIPVLGALGALAIVAACETRSTAPFESDVDLRPRFAVAQAPLINFENKTVGESVEGPGTMHPDLEINALLGDAVVIQTGIGTLAGNNIAYQAPFFPSGGGSPYPHNCLEDADGIRVDLNADPNGVARGFSDLTAARITPSPQAYDFTILNEKTVSSFSIVMFDFGDYRSSTAGGDETNDGLLNPSGVTLTAFDADGNVVDQFVLSYDKNNENAIDGTLANRVSEYGDLYASGDACRDVDDGLDEKVDITSSATNVSGPGYLKMSVSGSGIVRVELRTASTGYDNNVGFDSIDFTIEDSLPFQCDDGPFVVQEKMAELYQVDRSVDPFKFNLLAGPFDFEINNLGIDEATGLLWGWKRCGTGVPENCPLTEQEVVTIDKTGTVTFRGRGALPSTERFFGGDVADSKFYLNWNGGGYIYTVNLPDLTYANTRQQITEGATICTNAPTNPCGRVADWAALNGFLYGGNDKGPPDVATGDGEIAILNPLTGERFDKTVADPSNLGPLPTGIGFGAVWFGSNGNLNLLRNRDNADPDVGKIFEIALNLGPGGPTDANPEIVSVRLGVVGTVSQFNDGTACAAAPAPAIDLVKDGALNLGDNGALDVGDLIDYTFTVTNTGSVTLFNVSVTDPLVSPIDCSPENNPIADLAPQESVQCTGSYAITEADIAAGQRDNTATAEGFDPDNNPVSDQDGHIEPLLALTVSKTAETSLDRTYTWSIDKTANWSALTLMPGQTIQVQYKVAVDATPSDGNHAVSGGITIVNNTQETATIESVTDEISGGPTVADVECQVSFQYGLPVGETLICDYSAVLPDASTQTNTATVTTSGLVLGRTATAPVDFANATVNPIDQCINVSDDKGTGSDMPLGEVCAANDFTYQLDIGPFSCGGDNTFKNRASFLTGDLGDTGSAEWMIPITVDCDDGCSLTPGYWKTHSGYGPAPYDDTWALLANGADTDFFWSGQTYYEVLWTEPQGDAYYILAHAYIAAQLNFLNGADPTAAQAAFDEATALFEQYEPAQVSGAKGKNGKELREQFIDWARILDDYNNGYNGPGHCSEEEVYIVPGGGGSSMHVGDLDASASSGKRDRWNANVTITVHDESDGALADATVSGLWSDGSSGSCFTNKSGQCAIDRNNIRSGDSITFTVTDVTHGAFTYSAADNHDEEDGDASDGTSIAVLKP